MRPVNLLPAEQRAHRPRGDGRSGYVVLGLLGFLLLMVVGVVLTGNSVNSRKSQLAEVKKDIADAKAQTGARSAFGDFHKIKQTRISSVSLLANDRFDWERMVRELSLVLPRGTALTEINATKGPQAAGASSSSSSTSSSSTSGSTGPTDPATVGQPSLHLLGCAAKQNDVAVLLVRLRQMHHVEDVELAESAEQVPESEGGTTSSSGSAAGSTGDECRPKTFKFDATVTFEQSVPLTGSQRAPVRLGGGS